MDNTPTWGMEVPTNRDFSYRIAATSDGPGAFLVRPVKIYDFNWDINSGVALTINPWDLFFSDARVLARVENFKNITSDLVIKVVLNGSAFHFGELIMCYQPIPQNDELFINNLVTDESLVNMSQMPHMYIKACEGQGGELTLPFLYPKNAVNVASREWDRLGKLHIRSVVPLGHVNGSTEPITVTIFAMAKNVDLSTPTGCNVGYFNESDEYMKPSVIATNVAKASGYLSDVPIVGKYMRSTELFASAMGKMFNAFGYSKPRTVADITLVRSQVGFELASTNIGDPMPVLAFDAKKEVNVDPRSVGLGSGDEMAIVPIAKRESYINTIFWDSSQPPETHLMSYCVTPMQGRLSSDSSYYLTASAFVSAPFMYWKGSQNFRFSVISSRMHRGRLRFVWDPIVNRAGNSGVYNTNYSVILDISEVTDKTIRIGWGQEMAFLPVEGLLTIPNFSETEFTNRNMFANGVLSVYVVNELTCPASTPTEVGIRVCTFMDDDFELMCPDSSMFEGTVIRIAPPPPIPNPEPSVPATPLDPPTAPDPTGGFRVDYETCTPTNFIPIGANKAWPTGLQGLVEVPLTAPYVPLVPTANNKMYLSFATTKALSTYTTLKVGLAPPTNVTETFVVNASAWYENGSVHILIPTTVTYTAGTKCEVEFKMPVLDAVGFGILQLEFPRTGQWRLTSYEGYADMGTWRNCTMTALNAASTCTSASVTAGDFTGLTVSGNAQVARFDIPAASQGTSPNERVACDLLVTGTGGNVHVAKLVYSDGTLSAASFTSAVPNNPTSGRLSTMSFSIPNTAGKTVVGIELATTTAALAVYRIGIFLPTVTNQAEILYKNQADEVPKGSADELAPLASGADSEIGPMCPGVEINSIYSGELITSIRQLLKRYVNDYRFLNQTNMNLTLHDVNLPGTGEVSLRALHPMDYFRSAFLGYKGSYRIKAYANRSSTGVGTSNNVVGAMRISRVSREFLRSGNTRFTSWLGWGGSTYSLVDNGGYVGAEIPYYSPLRFFPARLATTPNSSNWIGELFIGRDRIRYQLNCNFGIGTDVDVAKAAGEDYSLFFYVCPPVVTLY